VIMATLAEQRRAIRDSVNSSRAATGADERRATGRRIEAERRGESVVQDLNRLITPQTQRRTLRTVPPVGAVPVTRGRGNYTPPPATGGRGISWPLTEGSAGESAEYTRTYHDTPTVLITTDGLVALELPQIATITMRDANGSVGDMRFAKRPADNP
jgi:hypothetical protein